MRSDVAFIGFKESIVILVVATSFIFIHFNFYLIMGTMAEVWVKKETLKKIVETLDKKGEHGISLTISIADEMNQFQQNVDMFVKQTKEQQEAKTPRFYVANGSVFWSNSSPLVITKQMREEAKNSKTAKPQVPASAASGEDEDMPF